MQTFLEKEANVKRDELEALGYAEESIKQFPVADETIMTDGVSYEKQYSNKHKHAISQDVDKEGAGKGTLAPGHSSWQPHSYGGSKTVIDKKNFNTEQGGSPDDIQSRLKEETRSYFNKDNQYSKNYVTISANPRQYMK